MYFRDVQLLNAGKHSEQKLKQNRYLMRYWDNVRNQFCLHLPENIHFLGISKLNIYLGEFESHSFESPDKRGIAVLRRNDFNFSDFAALPEDEKDLVSLGYIEDSILLLCQKYSLPTELQDQIKTTSKKVRDSGFEHTTIHKKTSKWHKSRNFRAVTRLHFKKGGIDASLEITDKRGHVLSSFKVADSRIWEAVWFDLWRGKWIDDTFAIETRVGETYFEVSGPFGAAI